MDIVMKVLGALAPASVMKGGLGHAVKCSWVSSPWPCTYAAYVYTLYVYTCPGCTLRWRPQGWMGDTVARNAATDLIIWDGSWDRVAACVHPTLCTPGRVPFGQQL